MNTARKKFDEIMEYAFENDVDLGFITTAEMQYYIENPRELLKVIINKMASDY